MYNCLYYKTCLKFLKQQKGKIMKQQLKLILSLTLLVLLSGTFLLPFTDNKYNTANAEYANQYRTVRARHILVDTENEAWALKSRITEGESFEALAEKYSKCPSSEKGGDLGYFNRGQMVPEFEKVAFETPIGEVSDPVKTRFGWHLIKVTRKM